MHPSLSHMHTQQIGFMDTDSELRNNVGAGEQCKETRNLIYRRRYGGGGGLKRLVWVCRRKRRGEE